MKPLSAISCTVMLLVSITGGILKAEDGEGASTPYFQSYAFNVPILKGWDDQSTDDIAQFQLAEARATIRTATVATSDAVAGAEAELAAITGAAAPQPSYRDKVNLADGTWQVLVYDVDDETTASVMARQAGARVVVISFVERDPAARTALLTLAQADDSLGDASPEIALAAEAIGGLALGELAEVGSETLASGEWVVYTGEGAAAMGMVFGNDSYVALQVGAPGDLAALADAWNRTLLGFFITPDNSRYLALGLAVVIVILGTLVGSLYWRERNLRKDLALLEQLAQEGD